ncbi:MAG: sterol desaturase family protein [Rhizomicrobium sp.]
MSGKVDAMHIDPRALFNPVQLATPAFIGLVLLELVYARLTGRARYEASDTLTSLLMGLGSVIVGAAFAFMFVDLARLVRPLRVTELPFTLWVIIACFVADDVAYYWWHRASHRMRWLWANHVGHHSSQHYNLSTALRQPWTGALTPGLVFKLPLLLLGFPLSMLVFVGGVNLVYQFWIHTEAIGKLPRPFEFVFNTPSHHRVHHAVNPHYLDANYAGVFILWDRLFGSFVAEGETPRYGIVKNLCSFNPLVVASHEWLAIAADLRRARSLKEALGFFLGPPGWSADGSRETSDAIKARWRAQLSHAASAPAE